MKSKMQIMLQIKGYLFQENTNRKRLDMKLGGGHVGGKGEAGGVKWRR